MGDRDEVEEQICEWLGAEGVDDTWCGSDLESVLTCRPKNRSASMMRLLSREIECDGELLAV